LCLTIVQQDWNNIAIYRYTVSLILQFKSLWYSLFCVIYSQNINRNYMNNSRMISHTNHLSLTLKKIEKNGGSFKYHASKRESRLCWELLSFPVSFFVSHEVSRFVPTALFVTSVRNYLVISASKFFFSTLRGVRSHLDWHNL